MRLVLLSLAAGLAACSALPPEPVVPLRAGEGAAGLTLDIPVSGDRPGGLSIWGGLGVGGGVDASLSIDAPLSLIAELGAVGRGDRPFLPPGIALRKSFANGAAIGVGVASLRTPLEPAPPLRGLMSMTVGPFVSVGSADAEGPAVARASAHLVHEVRVTRRDSVASVRRGLALWGVGRAGPVVRPSNGAVVPGARVTAGAWLASPRDVSVTAGPTVEGVGALSD